MHSGWATSTSEHWNFVFANPILSPYKWQSESTRFPNKEGKCKKPMGVLQFYVLRWNHLDVIYFQFKASVWYIVRRQWGAFDIGLQTLESVIWITRDNFCSSLLTFNNK